MIHRQFNDKPIDYAVASIHIYNMMDVPFNRGLKTAQVWDFKDKLTIIANAIETFLEFDPGIYLEKFIIVNSGTNDRNTMTYYAALDGKVTKYGTRVEVLDAPDVEFPGPYGARQAVYRKYPAYKYYFDCDNDCIPMMDGWYKDGIERLSRDSEIGLLGGNISRQEYQCKSNINWYDPFGNQVPAPSLKYNSGFWTFIPGHIYQLFDRYWGTDWFGQGSSYYDVTASQGELGFPFKIMQLGYKIADYDDDETDAFYSYIVPDVLVPNRTVGDVDEYPTKQKVCPFYHVQLKMAMPEKWAYLQEYLKGK
jgi:hypothetical protein